MRLNQNCLRDEIKRLYKNPKISKATRIGFGIWKSRKPWIFSYFSYSVPGARLFVIIGNFSPNWKSEIPQVRIRNLCPRDLKKNPGIPNFQIRYFFCYFRIVILGTDIFREIGYLEKKPPPRSIKSGGPKKSWILYYPSLE